MQTLSPLDEILLIHRKFHFYHFFSHPLYTYCYFFVIFMQSGA
jgi:hypothetical protein